MEKGNVTDESETESVQSNPPSPIPQAKPKTNKKKTRSEAQVKAFEKARQKRLANIKLKKEIIEDEKIEKLIEKKNKLKQSEPIDIPNTTPSSPIPKPILKKSKKKKQVNIVYDSTSSSDSEIEYVVKSKNKKKNKKKKQVEYESDDSLESFENQNYNDDFEPVKQNIPNYYYV